jgi:hypothetical protein
MRRSLSLSLALLALAANAHAEPQACFDAAVDGQKQRDAGKLLAARTQFIACAKSGCPDEVQKDCARWLSEVDATLPTVVFGARDGSGRDLLDVRVTVDGTPVGDTAQGKPVPLDPGKHEVKFERDGQPPYQQTLVVRAGEKNRSVVAELPSPAGAAESSHVPIATFVLGGVGVVALGVFAYVGAHGVSDYHRLNCDTGCSASDKSSVDRQFRIADIALGVGVAALAAGTIVWLVAPTKPNKPAVGLGVAPIARGSYGTLTVRF